MLLSRPYPAWSILMQRFQVSEDSMRPTLAPGDEFVATASRTAEIGEVVALPHPDRQDFWLVKRLAAGPGALVDGHGPLARDRAWVISDNPDVATADSRSFGPVPVSSLQPMVTRLDDATFLEALDLLASEDPALAAVVELHGVPRFWSRPAGFATLVWLIMEQQVSLESGAAMYHRLHGLLGAITPERVAGSTEPALREIGVTRQKTRYLLDLGRLVASGEFDLDALATMPLTEARDLLLGVKGIGPWTADVYLLSALRFPDVFPLGDRALQVGTGEVLGMTSVPNGEELELLSLPWRPIRAVAARIIWHAYLGRRGRAEPPDPTRGHGVARPA
ncbi:MAG TPA: S26 family signal peptidase [Acidimicrobiia bacterium]|nr:S26 family signal peptidase [Acidimicrobiia bacterium]